MSSERAKLETLTLDTNRLVSVEFDRFDVVFPYDYNFADTVDEARFPASVKFVRNFFLRLIFMPIFYFVVYRCYLSVVCVGCHHLTR